jgi:serine/threonine protein kinase
VGVQAALLQSLITSAFSDGSRFVLRDVDEHSVWLGAAEYVVKLNRAIIRVEKALFLQAKKSDSSAIQRRFCEMLQLVPQRFQYFFDVMQLNYQLHHSTENDAFSVMPKRVNYHFVVVPDEIDPLSMTLEQNVFLAAYLKDCSEAAILKYGKTAGFFVQPGGQCVKLLQSAEGTAGVILKIYLKNRLVARHTYREPHERRYDIIAKAPVQSISHHPEGDSSSGLFPVLGRLIPYGNNELLLLKKVNDAVVKIWCPNFPNQQLADLKAEMIQKQTVDEQKNLAHVLEEVNQSVLYGDAVARRLVHLRSKPTAIIYEAGFNRLYLAQAMRYLSGKLVAEVIEHDREARKSRHARDQKPLSANRLLERARRYALAVLEQAVLAGVVHGDIKPRNMLDDGNEFGVFLIDPDSAQFSERMDVGRYTGATLGYAGPEYYWPHLRPGPNSDVYSLYVVLKRLFGADRPSFDLSATFRADKMFAGLFADIPDFYYGEICRMQALFHTMARANPEERCSVEAVVDYFDAMILSRLQQSFPRLYLSLKNTFISAKVIQRQLWQLARIEKMKIPSWEMGRVYLDKLAQMRAVFATPDLNYLDADPLLFRYFVFILHVAVFSKSSTNARELQALAIELIDHCADVIKDIDLFYDRIHYYQERLRQLNVKKIDLAQQEICARLSLFEGKIDAVFARCHDYTFTIDHLCLLVGDESNGGKLVKAHQNLLEELDEIALSVRVLEAGYTGQPLPTWLTKSTIRETYAVEDGDRPRGRAGYDQFKSDRLISDTIDQSDPLPTRLIPNLRGLSRVSLFASSHSGTTASSSTSSSSDYSTYDSSGSDQVRGSRSDSDESRASRSSRSF